MNSKRLTNSFANTNTNSLIAFALPLIALMAGCAGVPGTVSHFASNSTPGITVRALTPSGAYRAGQNLQFEVSFPSAVQVVGYPTLDLSTGRSAAQANYVRGSGSNKLVFEYTVHPGDDIVLLDYLNSSSLKAHSGAILPLKGMELRLVLPTPGSQGSISHSASIEIDTKAPTEFSDLNDGTGIADTNSAPTASWKHASDVSALVYEIAIGTSPGATDVLGWTTKSALNTATHRGLSLASGKRYYTSVRAVDAAGNIGPAVSGDGWRAVDPHTLSAALKQQSVADQSKEVTLYWLAN